MPSQLQEENGDELCQFLADHERNSYLSIRDLIPSEAIEAGRRRRVIEWLQQPEERLFQEKNRAGLIGVARWSDLPWDSRHFGFPAARIDSLIAAGAYAEQRSVLRSLLDLVVRSNELAGIQHLTTRVDTGELATVHALGEAKFEFIDGIQTFGLRLHRCQKIGSQSTSDLRIGLIQDSQFEAVVEIGKSAYQFDRFHSDPALPDGVADRLHGDWLANSCSGKAADAVFVASNSREVLGFVTVKFDREMNEFCRIRLATIVLVATAEHCRGNGVAKAMTLEALRWLKDKGTVFVQVGTQLRNIAASRLYEACGFRLTNTSLTFRRNFFDQ